MSRTLTYSNGYFVMLNRTAWRGGIVESPDEAQVVERVKVALINPKDLQGASVVTGAYVPEDFPELGMGGPTGGVDAGHGFLPTEPDMRTVFCAVGSTLRAHRMEPVYLTVVAPAVAEWVGVSPPRDAVGESVLGKLRGQN